MTRISVVYAALVILILVLIASVIGTRQFASCQAEYNRLTNERMSILSDVNIYERAAERERINAGDAIIFDSALIVMPAERTPEQTARLRKELETFIRAARAAKLARETADQIRAENPMPPAADVCDGSV